MEGQQPSNQESNGMVNGDSSNQIANHADGNQIDNTDSSSMNATTSNSDSSESTVDVVIPSTPPSKEYQLNTLKNSILARLELSSKVYLFPTKWYDAFNSWASGTSGNEPGRVDPAGTLLDLDGVLKEDAIEQQDWLVTNEQGWSLIERWYDSLFPQNLNTFAYM